MRKNNLALKKIASDSGFDLFGFAFLAAQNKSSSHRTEKINNSNFASENYFIIG